MKTKQMFVGLGAVAALGLAVVPMASYAVTDVDSSICPDLFQHDGVLKMVISRSRKRSAGLRLGNDIYDILAGDGLRLDDNCAVQVLAALGGEIDPALRDRFIDSRKDGLRHLR